MNLKNKIELEQNDITKDTEKSSVNNDLNNTTTRRKIYKKLAQCIDCKEWRLARNPGIRCRKCSNSGGEHSPTFGKRWTISAEGRERRSAHQRGEKGFWFGKHLPTETRKKQSDANRIYTEEGKYSAEKQSKHFYSWFVLNRNNGFEKYVGSSLNEFKLIIESKFNNTMNWNNYGVKGWHIDHIYPLSSFNVTIEEEVKKAWNWTNLQPLWWIDNLKKGARLPTI